MPLLRFRRNKRRFSAAQILVLFYLVSAILSTGLLSIPYFHQPGVQLTLMDALFTAVSAISVTGLSVVNAADTFNLFGSFALAMIFQVGGIGIMTIGTFLWILIGKRIGLSGRQWIAIDQNQPTLAGVVSLMKGMLLMTILIEAIGAIALGARFFVQGYIQDWRDALFYGFFTAVSAFTNAGFDIFGDSLYQFSEDYFVQTTIMILIVLGAIGFPVLIEVRAFLASGRKKEPFRFSLYTKLTTSTFFGLTILGAVFFYLFERNAFLAGQSWQATIFYALFHSVTARSCGLSTTDMNEFSDPTLLLMSVLMFIGASPSSVGGGIRTTTFIVAILSVIAFMRGRSSVFAFRRELHEDDTRKSFVVFFVGSGLVATTTICLAAWESFPLMKIFFEVCSAFGTTGLSLGITPELGAASKGALMFLMFVGRVGIITFLTLLKREKKLGYHYPKERMIIG